MTTTPTPEQILHLWDTQPYDPTIWPLATVAALRQAIAERDQALARVQELEAQPKHLWLVRAEKAEARVAGLERWIAANHAPCKHPFITIDRCGKCGAYVGPQP